jgi:hypothetical protein
MIRVTPETLLPETLPKDTSLQTTPKTPCTHSRLVDEVLSTKGTKTGQLICKECKAVFPDPVFQESAH